MPLESLLKLVEKLSERIDTHGPTLRGSEALTRSALIDPLLRELGWDTSDPALVILEYRSGTGRADYALLNNGVPAIMLEAKKLDEPLQDSVLSQGINYCLMEGTGFFCVTDGRRWETYETHRPVPIDQKRIARFDLKEGSAAEVCLKALALWRPSVQAGHVVLGETPIVGLDDGLPGSVNPPAQVEDDPQQSASITAHHQWQRLTDLTATKGKKPFEVLFPDGSRTPTKTWGNVPVEVVRWLWYKGMLNASHCPIKSETPRAVLYMVHTQPIHSNGAQFKAPTKVNGLYVDKHGNSPSLINTTKTIIQRVDQDPTQFKVRFS